MNSLDAGIENMPIKFVYDTVVVHPIQTSPRSCFVVLGIPLKSQPLCNDFGG